MCYFLRYLGYLESNIGKKKNPVHVELLISNLIVLKLEKVVKFFSVCWNLSYYHRVLFFPWCSVWHSWFLLKSLGHVCSWGCSGASWLGWPMPERLSGEAACLFLPGLVSVLALFFSKQGWCELVELFCLPVSGLCMVAFPIFIKLFEINLIQYGIVVSLLSCWFCLFWFFTLLSSPAVFPVSLL